jgi:hypothetical protein
MCNEKSGNNCYDLWLVLRLELNKFLGYLMCMRWDGGIAFVPEIIIYFGL